MILYCDPSAAAFGYAIMDGDRYVSGGMRKLTPEGKDSLARKCLAISMNCLTMLDELTRTHAIGAVVTELPHGSQSAVAAWYLSTVNSTLYVYCMLKGIPITHISESDAKKTLHGRSRGVEKQETVDRLIDIYPSFSYIPANVRTKVELYAIADSLAIYHHHKESKQWDADVLVRKAEASVANGEGKLQRPVEKTLRRRQAQKQENVHRKLEEPEMEKGKTVPRPRVKPKPTTKKPK